MKAARQIAAASRPSAPGHPLPIRPAARSATAPAAHLPPDDRQRQNLLKDAQQELYKSPTTGRNTKLGRKVEKPAEPGPGGPSGQKDRARHDRKHANK